MNLTHIDLFAGIGGFSLGFERAGIDTLAHVEIDPKCQEVLRRNWSDHLIFSDVCEVGKHNLPYADIITFGSPCQDLSIAGKRKGIQGERSGLFYQAVRIIREIEPRYAVWENVPGALSSNNGRDFQSVLESLIQHIVPMPKSGRWAAAGMVRVGQKEVAWRILDAQYFGVAQRRRRLFLIFCAGGGSPSSILFEREGVRWNPPARRKEMEGTAGSVEESSTLGFDLAQITSKANYSNPKQGDPQPPLNCAAQGYVAYENHPADSRITETGDISQQLTSRMGTGGNNVPLVQHVPDVAGTLDGGSSKCHSGITAGQADANVVATSRTLRQGKDGGGKGYLEFQDGAMTLGGQPQFVGVRRLTPTECARLQGFPDTWNDWLSDSARYKQYGNAVCVNVAEWIGRRIMEVV